MRDRRVVALGWRVAATVVTAVAHDSLLMPVRAGPGLTGAELARRLEVTAPWPSCDDAVLLAGRGPLVGRAGEGDLAATDGASPASRRRDSSTNGKALGGL